MRKPGNLKTSLWDVARFEPSSVIMIALTVASAALSAVGSIRQGQAASNAAKFNAKVAENNAIASRQQAAEEEARQRRQSRRALGAQRAAFGKAGVTLAGSPLDVLVDSNLESELDSLTIRHSGEVQAQGFLSQAELLRSKARNARTAGFIGAGTALLGGASKVANNFPTSSEPSFKTDAAGRLLGPV